MTGTYAESPVLAIYATSRGFGYVLFEGPESPYDWGVREIREKHSVAKTLDAMKNLIDRYRPEVIVIEDTSDRKQRPSSRIRKLYRMLMHLANTEFVEVYRFPNEAVKRYFGSVGASTKFEIAQAIARQIPAFAHRMPAYRKAWMNVDPRQSLFDAAALGLVFYASRGIPSPYYPKDDA